MAGETVVIATIRPWNITLAKAWRSSGYRVVVISDPKNLSYARLKRLGARYVFFPHWSWLISKDVYENFECIVFHMTDLPFGRGGSPLQNLLSRGITKTKVSAIRVDGGLDTGPVYMKRPLDISKGSAREIYEKVSALSFAMIRDILRHSPRPRPQKGRATAFKRRTPEMSRVPKGLTARQMYDFIRMLDAPGYPTAFFEGGGIRVDLCDARLEGNTVVARATITTT
jgi:methionyl-tRNA formyltransferase